MSPPAAQAFMQLDTWDIDPTKPATSQLWQSREEGEVRAIAHFTCDGAITHFDSKGCCYVTTENLVTKWRCVDSLPRDMLFLGSRLVRTWREMALAAQIMHMTQSTRSV